MKRMMMLMCCGAILMASQAFAGEPEGDASSPVQLGVEEVRVKVDGLACPFCAYNIEKRMKTLDGVDRTSKFNVSVEQGLDTFAWKPSVAFSPDAVNKQVKRAGFSPGSIAVTVTGQITVKKSEDEGRPGTPQLHLPSTGQKIALSAETRVDRAESHALLLRNAEGLEKEASFAVRVDAVVQVANGSWSLKLNRWEPLDYGAKVVVDVEKFACERCSTGAMRSLSEVSGVIHTEADHEANQAVIWTKDVKPSIAEIEKAVENAGFKVTKVEATPRENGGGRKSN